ncbi:hypothetical protein ACFGZK_10935 [Pasteurella multocida]
MRTLLTVTRKILAPTSNETRYLPYQGQVVFSISTVHGHNKIEVYQPHENENTFEWRIVDLKTDDLGVERKVVIYDSVEALYNNYKAALLDALLFCQLEFL